MAELIIKIPKTPDRAVLVRFAQIQNQFNFNSSLAQGPLGVNISPIPATIEAGETNNALNTILKADGYILVHATLTMPGLSVAFYRGGTGGSDPFFDEIRFQYSDQGHPPEDLRLSIVAAVQKEFQTFDPERGIALPLPESAKLAALYQQRLDRLEDLGSELVRRTTETYGRLEKEFHERKLANDADLATHKAELDSEFQRKHELLRNEEAALEEKRKDLDDRSNTHARRALRDRMLENVESRIAKFGVSDLTAQKRNPVRLTMILLCAVLLCLTAWTAVELTSQQQLFKEASHAVIAAAAQDVKTQPVAKDVGSPALTALADFSRTLMYLLWIRLSLFGLGTVAALIYYIRWENRWADQHSNAEFQLHQFRLDVNRANWVIESGLEWRKETGTVVPKGILESLTRNLFRSQDESPPALHPADELASALLGSASKLRLKTGDNELEFNKPGKIPKE
jgi:hypothetical protein